MSILLTGGGGQLGQAFRRRAAAAGLRVVAPPRTELDLADQASIRRALSNGAWEAIVNCGAFTAVDAAETHIDSARAVNSQAPGILAQEAARSGAFLVHLSTDYVFDGRSGPYAEEDLIRPLNVYGKTKAEGEAAIRAVTDEHAIVRTSWVLSGDGNNFLLTMLRLAAEREELRIVDDQVGRPTSTTDLADALLSILGARARGTWHFANSGEATWYKLASFIIAEGIPEARRPKLLPVSTGEFPTPAVRPADSRLSTAKYEHAFGVTPRDWQAAVREIIRGLRGPTLAEDLVSEPNGQQGAQLNPGRC